MNKTLISAILLSHPALSLSTAALAEAKALSRQANAQLLQQHFQSDAIFTNSEGEHFRLVIDFAKIANVPVNKDNVDLDLDYSVLVHAVNLKTGEVLYDGMDYYVKALDEKGHFTFHNCDSTNVCKGQQTNLSISQLNGQTKLEIKSADSVHLFDYYLDINGPVSFSEVK